jgi:hypothetical protein
MIPSKLIKILELVVPTAGGDELTFRLEICQEVVRRKRRYRLRFYRLELVRFLVRFQGAKPNRRWQHADYRCWVVDDNLFDDRAVYRSLRSAEDHFRRTFGSQLLKRRPARFKSEERRVR